MTSATPTQITDLHGLAPVARSYIQNLLTRLLGSVDLSYDFYREWNGGWCVRVGVSGRVNGTLDCVLLTTPQGGIMILPRPLPERWRTTTGIEASDGSVWTLNNDGEIVPFTLPARS